MLTVALAMWLEESQKPKKAHFVASSKNNALVRCFFLTLPKIRIAIFTKLSDIWVMGN
jgi:hypothetical protein